MSEMTQRPQSFSLRGITAQAASASTDATSGATSNTPSSGPAGNSGSSSTNMNSSALYSNGPNGPTTLGPRRNCTAAHTLRSISSRKAMVTSRTTSSSTLSSTMRRSGHRKGCQMSVQNQPLSMRPRRVLLPPLLERAQFGHDARGTGDRIGEIEVDDGARKGFRADRTGARRQPGHAIGLRRGDDIQAQQLRRHARHGGAQARDMVVGKGVPDVGRQSANDGPILLGFTGSEAGAARHLGAAFEVDIGGSLLGVGSARQHHVGAVGTGIAVTALIDDEIGRAHV